MSVLTIYNHSGASGPVAPTFSAPVETTWDTTGTSKTLSLSWAQNDRIIIFAVTADQTLTIGTPTGGGLTFAPIGSAVATADACWGHRWVATAASAGSGTITLTSTGNSTITWGAIAYVVTGASAINSIAGISDDESAVAASTTSDNSAVMMVIARKVPQTIPRSYYSTAGQGLETVEPSNATCGTLPGITRASVSGNVTLTATDSPYENKTVSGRITIAANNHVVLNNVRANELHCEASGASCEINDSELRPTGAILYTHGGALVGHDIVAKRLKMSGHIDGIVIRNTSAVANPYQTGVEMYHCWVNRLVYWTGAVGTVHSSDTWSHNDCVQHMGGYGSIFIGCKFDANFEHQVGHWLTVGGSETEPYNGVAVGSLDGTLPLWRIPDRGDGTAATGRYNSDSASDGTKSISLTCFLIGNNFINGFTHLSRNITVNYCWFYGGDMMFNGGGFNRGSETTQLLTFIGNRFGRDSGNQGTGGNTTYTLAGFGSGWSAYITRSNNTYVDNGAAITERIP